MRLFGKAYAARDPNRDEVNYVDTDMGADELPEDEESRSSLSSSDVEDEAAPHVAYVPPMPRPGDSTIHSASSRAVSDVAGGEEEDEEDRKRIQAEWERFYMQAYMEEVSKHKEQKVSRHEQRALAKMPKPVAYRPQPDSDDDSDDLVYGLPEEAALSVSTSGSDLNSEDEANIRMILERKLEEEWEKFYFKHYVQDIPQPMSKNLSKSKSKYKLTYMYSQKGENDEDNISEPEELTTKSSEKVVIPPFLRDYSQQRTDDIELGEFAVRNDDLILTRGIVDTSRKVAFDPVKRRFQLWFQIAGILAFTLYELPVIIARIYMADDQKMENFQHLWFGVAGSVVMIPCICIAFYRTSWQYLKRTSKLMDWMVYAIQVIIPIPAGYRKYAYGTHGTFFPWMSVMFVASWALFYILTGPYAQSLGLSDMCSPTNLNEITFKNLMANFFHASTFHVLSNSIFLLLASIASECSYGSVRAYLPVIVGIPFIEAIYGFCGYVGGSAVWGLLMGTSVGVWFATLHWKANWDEWNYTANFSRGFSQLYIMNCVQVAGDALRKENEAPISNWVHASAQLLGCYLALAFLFVFSRPFLRAPGEYGPKDPKPTKDSNRWWYSWYYITSALGLVASTVYIAVGFVTNNHGPS